MRALLLCFAVASCLTGQAVSQDKPAYRLYKSGGKEVKWEKMLKDLAAADVVFFGEQHNDPIGHWLELQLTKDLFVARDSQLVLGAEMFEHDNQVILDEFLAGKFDDSKFEDDARLWQNYDTDYKPLLSFAHDHGLYFVATDVPRRYASMVFRGGFESLEDLSAQAKTFIAPLPVPYDPGLSCYKNMASMGMGHAPSENLPKAQAIKDATMGYFITENTRPGYIFLHFNGEYHSENKEGTVWYVNQYAPGLSVKTISAVFQEDTGKLDEPNLNIADYIIVVPGDMTRTF